MRELLSSIHANVSGVATSLFTVLFFPLDSVVICTSPTVSIRMVSNLEPRDMSCACVHASQLSMVPLAVSSFIALMITVRFQCPSFLAEASTKRFQSLASCFRRSANLNSSSTCSAAFFTMLCRVPYLIEIPLMMNFINTNAITLASPPDSNFLAEPARPPRPNGASISSRIPSANLAKPCVNIACPYWVPLSPL